MKRSLEDTEVLDDDFVELLEDECNIDEEIIKHINMPKQYLKAVIYIAVLSFLTFQSIYFMQISTKIRDTSLDVEKDPLYEYRKVEFGDVQFS